MSMNKQIRDAFDGIHAEEELKNSVKTYLARQMAQQVPKKNSLRPMFVSLAACVLIFFMGAGGGWLYLTPTAVASFDVNPSMEVVINRFDRVVSVKGYNEDGKALAQALHIRNMEYEDAMEEILKEEQVQSLLEDGYLTITVAGPDEKQCARVLDAARIHTEGHRNAHCYMAGEEDLKSAHDLGMSCGKYRAYLDVLALDPDITPEEIQAMSMREIRELISSLSGETAADTEQQDTYMGEEEDCETRQESGDFAGESCEPEQSSRTYPGQVSEPEHSGGMYAGEDCAPQNENAYSGEPRGHGGYEGRHGHHGGG